MSLPQIFSCVCVGGGGRNTSPLDQHDSLDNNKKTQKIREIFSEGICDFKKGLSLKYMNVKQKVTKKITRKILAAIIFTSFQ